jgi:polygalacturonase
VGDGKTKDTAAIQQPLDRCSVLGGGGVLIPEGEYLAGAIVLRSNTLLRIARDATLLGSPDLIDYPLTQVRWEGLWVNGHIGFISAIGGENIGIVGGGKSSAILQLRADSMGKLSFAIRRKLNSPVVSTFDWRIVPPFRMTCGRFILRIARTSPSPGIAFVC